MSPMGGCVQRKRQNQDRLPLPIIVREFTAIPIRSSGYGIHLLSEAGAAKLLGHDPFSLSMCPNKEVVSTIINVVGVGE